MQQFFGNSSDAPLAEQLVAIRHAAVFNFFPWGRGLEKTGCRFSLFWTGVQRTFFAQLRNQPMVSGHVCHPSALKVRLRVEIF